MELCAQIICPDAHEMEMRHGSKRKMGVEGEQLVENQVKIKPLNLGVGKTREVTLSTGPERTTQQVGSRGFVGVRCASEGRAPGGGKRFVFSGRGLLLKGKEAGISGRLGYLGRTRGPDPLQNGGFGKNVHRERKKGGEKRKTLRKDDNNF